MGLVVEQALLPACSAVFSTVPSSSGAGPSEAAARRSEKARASLPLALEVPREGLLRLKVRRMMVVMRTQAPETSAARPRLACP